MPIHIRTGLLVFAIVAGACIDDIPDEELEASDSDDTAHEARGLGLGADADPAELPPVGESPLCPAEGGARCLNSSQCFVFDPMGPNRLPGTSSKGWLGWPYEGSCYPYADTPPTPCDGRIALCGPVCY